MKVAAELLVEVDVDVDVEVVVEAVDVDVEAVDEVLLVDVGLVGVPASSQAAPIKAASAMAETFLRT